MSARACRLDQLVLEVRFFSADPSGAWRVQLQGGGGSQRGALATDDNAADGRHGVHLGLQSGAQRDELGEEVGIMMMPTSWVVR